MLAPSTHRARQCRRLLARVALAAIAPLLAGCDEWDPLQRPAQQACQEFAAAQQLYVQSRWRDDQAAALRENRDQLVRKLRQVIDLSENTPLFWSKLGDVRLELGPDAYSVAHEDFLRAKALSRYWIPADLGLARYEMFAGNPANAEGYLADAEKSLATLRKLAGELNRRDAARAHRGAAPDPALPIAEQFRLFVTWLDWNERWQPENPVAVELGPGSDVGQSVVTALERRLHARIEYQRAELMIVGRRPGVDVIARLDRALAWDPDFTTATIEKACQLRRNGQLDEAESLLEPYVRARGNPPFARSGRLVYELAMLYAARYAREGGEKWFDAATDYFLRLLSDELNPRHATGLYGYALHVREGGRRARRPDFLEAAVKYLDQARQLDPALPNVDEERAQTVRLLDELTESRHEKPRA